MMPEWNPEKFDSDLLIDCFREYGASVTPGTGKLFVGGQEMTIEDVFNAMKIVEENVPNVRNSLF